MISQALTVFRKELKDMIRDRRMVIAALSFALLGPAVLVFIVFLTQDNDAAAERVRVALTNADQAPGLVAFLERADIAVEPYEVPEGSGLRQGVAPGGLPEDADGLIVLPTDFAKRLSAGQMISARLFIDDTTVSAIEKGNSIGAAVTGYASHVASTRLITRGVPPLVAAPVVLQTVSLAEKSLARQFLSDGLMLFFILAPFVGSMSVAVDTLAGERERHSMQPLLAQPVSALSVILGKFGMVLTFSYVGTCLTVVAVFIALGVIPADVLPISAHLDPVTAVGTMLMLFPLAVLVSAAQLFISIQVKSFKEGQSYLSMLMFVPMIVGYLKVYGSAKLPEGAQYLPILADMEGLGLLVFDGVFEPVYVGTTALVSIIATTLLILLTARKTQSEVMLDAA